MSLRRFGSTDVQEEALADVEDIANAIGFKLSMGTSVGKHPQAVLLDHAPEDGIVRVNSDGEVIFDGRQLISLRHGDFWGDFKAAVEKYHEEHNKEGKRIKVPAKGDTVGSACMYCGFSRMDDQPKQKAKVGHIGWLDVGQETAQKVGKLQLADKLYMLVVCPACGAIIDAIEK